jgi:hypothetical protein
MMELMVFEKQVIKEDESTVYLDIAGTWIGGIHFKII